MRKLSKKISMLMVLAMLVSLFSGVVSASAASAWSFKSGKYAVAVNGTINMESKEYADFDLLKDGKAPAGYTVAWESSDEDVVWVNAKTGQLRADKFGKAEDGDKAEISATFTNAKTGKSATRSFFIVLGTVEYTVEAADVSIELGAEVKFAPVVKDEAGKTVKFATHKSYNGYFLDGKAIANPWTPEEAGEYTVTVAQFAKKADVADLAKAVRTTEVTVTVAEAEAAAIDAKATGVKEITVYGEFAKDAKFTVNKGAQNVSFTAAVAEDGKSAKLALVNKLTEGTYTVVCGDAKVDIVAENEKADKIIILEKDGQILTGKENTEAYIHYDVLNQYGESVRRAFDPTWSCTAEVDSVDRNNGIITITKDEFDYNDMVVLTGVVTGYGFAVSETANMTIGLAQNINSVEFVGIVKGEGTDLVEEIPASYVGGPYYLVFATYDNAGNLIEFDADNAKDDLKFISMNPLLAKFANEVAVDTVYIDGVAYGKVKIEKPDTDTQLKKGGVADINVTSTKTGKNTPYSIRIVSEQILDTFKIFAPDTLLIRNNVKDENSTFTFGFEALDTAGEKITDFRALYKAVQFSDSNVKLEENNDGTAKLTFNTAGVESNDGFDSIAVFNATVLTSGKSEQVRLDIKPDRYAASVSKLASKNSASEYVVEGNSIEIGFVTDTKDLWIEFNDQYDEELDKKTNNLFRKGQYVAVKPVEAGVLSVVTGGAGYITTLKDGTVLFDVIAEEEKDDKMEYVCNSVKLTAANDVLVSKKAAVVEFAIYEADDDSDEGYKLVGGSDKKITFYVVDIDQCVEFSVGCGRWWTNLWQYNNHKNYYGVSATLANGKKVNLQNEVVGNYYINYATSNKDNLFVEQVSATSGAGVEVKPELKVATGTSVFFDYSAPTAVEGIYAPRNHKIDVTATIYGADHNVKGSATSTIEVSNRDAYPVSLAFNEDWNRHWTVSLSGDKTTGTVKATEGVITKAQLNSVFKGVNNYYNDVDSVTIDLTITKLVESENGLNPAGEDEIFALATGDNALENAEIGDTFVATYSFGDLSHTIKFTVGSDLNAYVSGSNFNTGVWR